MSKSTCPGCKGTQKDVPFRTHRIRVCANCGSRTVKNDVLASLMSETDLKAFWKAGMAAMAPKTGGKACPDCGRTLRLMVAMDMGKAKLELDSCHECSLVWFDPGEIERLALSKTPKAPKSIARTLSPGVQREVNTRDAKRALGIDPDIAEKTYDFLLGRWLYRSNNGNWYDDQGVPCRLAPTLPGSARRRTGLFDLLVGLADLPKKP